MNTKTLKTKKNILIILVIILCFVHNLSAQDNLGQRCNCDQEVENYNKSLKILEEAEKEYQKVKDRSDKRQNELAIYIKNNNLDIAKFNTWTKEQQNYILPYLGGENLSHTKEAQALFESRADEQRSKERMEQCLDLKSYPTYCQKCNSDGFIENDNTKINKETCVNCKDGVIVELEDNFMCCNGIPVEKEYTWKKTIIFKGPFSSQMQPLVTYHNTEPENSADGITGQQANSFSIEAGTISVTIEKELKTCSPIDVSNEFFDPKTSPDGCVSDAMEAFKNILGF